MKKVLVLALAGVALAACKKVEPEGPQLPDGPSVEINFTTAADVTKGQTVDYDANPSAAKNFYLGDQIGVYMANNASEISVLPYIFEPRKTVPVVTDKNEAVNYGYTYATPYWAAITAPAERLSYPSSGKAASPNKAQLYAYFPYTRAAGSTMSLITDPAGSESKSELLYTYKADQTANADLRVLDVMWAKNTGKTGFEGWDAQTAAIPLEFNHLMTKLQFTIKLKHSNGTEVRYLRAIEVKGPEINVQNAIFDVVAGTLKPKVIQATPGSVFYLNQSQTAEDVFKGTAHADPKASAANGRMEMTKDSKTLTFNDLLIYPFGQTPSVNNFVFYLTKDLSKAYTTMAELYAAVTAGEVEVYSAQIGDAVSTSGSEMYLFKAGVNNVMTVTIDIENPAINVTATIKSWVPTEEQEIPAQ